MRHLSTDHFSLRLTSPFISLMLLLLCRPIPNWPEKQKRRDYFPDLILLKRIVLHLSTVFCLTAFVCQLAFVRAQQEPRQRYMEGETRKAQRCQMLTCQREETKEGARGLRAARAPPCSSPHLSLPYCSHLHDRYIGGSFKAGGSELIVTSRTPENSKINFKKSHLLMENMQHTSLSVTKRTCHTLWVVVVL